MMVRLCFVPSFHFEATLSFLHFLDFILLNKLSFFTFTFSFTFVTVMRLGGGWKNEPWGYIEKDKMIGNITICFFNFFFCKTTLFLNKAMIQMKVDTNYHLQTILPTNNIELTHDFFSFLYLCTNMTQTVLNEVDA
jgi:hypothetical protein